MRFDLVPTSFRKMVGIDGEGTRQSISFDTHLAAAAGRDSEYDPSTFKDGRPISSVGCTVSIYSGKSAEISGTLSFAPAFSDNELQINEPDRLQLQVSISPDAFDLLWAIVSDGKMILLGGEVEGLPSKYPYSPGFSPYIWDVEKKENRHKPIKKFWFSDLITANQDTKKRLEAIRSQGDTLSASAAKLRKVLKEKYLGSPQMYRICLRALDQAESEAARRDLTGEDASRFLEDTFDLPAIVQTSLHGYDSKPEDHESEGIWRYQNIDKLISEGREALGNLTINQDDLSGVCRDLLQRPWLRLDELEWIVVSALVFREVFEFGETVKKGAGSFSQAWAYTSAKGNVKKMGWAKLRVAGFWWLVRWGLVAAGMYGAWDLVERNQYQGFSEFAVLCSSLLILLWLFIGFPIGRRAVKEARQKRAKLLMAMRDAYITMKPDGPLSPYQIRAAMLTAHEMGAVWPAGTFALLDRAAMRDTPAWVIW